MLGPLEVTAGRVISLGGPRHQVVIAMLLLEPGQIVTIDRLTTALYDDDPPRTATSQVRFCISQLRRQFADFDETALILTRPPGYLLDVPDDRLDLAEFRRCVAAARRAAACQELEAAADAFRAGLALWRGDALDGLASTSIQAVAAALNEERFSALQHCIDLELQLARHTDLIGELRQLAATYPLREGLHSRLAVALSMANRQVEALEVLRGIRQTLQEDYGLTPTPELRLVEDAILNQTIPSGGLPPVFNR
jgi:DNA-binding SARP family transcriptional activator